MGKKEHKGKNLSQAFIFTSLVVTRVSHALGMRETRKEGVDKTWLFL